MRTSAPTRDQTFQRLLAAEAEIRQLGVRRLALFGSVARDEARSDSDVDLLVEFAPGQKTIVSWLFPIFWKNWWDIPSNWSRSRRSPLSSAPTSWLKRRMSFEPREYLRHILTEADYLIGRR